MRQQDDRNFAELLTRIRRKSQTEEYIKTLTVFMISQTDKHYPADALHIFSTNALVNQHNRKKLSELLNPVIHTEAEDTSKEILTGQLLFVLRFYGPVNPMGSCRARSVYLTTRLLGRLSPLSG